MLKLVEPSAKRKCRDGGGHPALGNNYSVSALKDFRPRWHHFAAGLLRWSGALTVGQRLARRHAISSSSNKFLPRVQVAEVPRILILCYHRIGIGGIPFYSELSTQLFEAQMRFLRRNYQILSLADACRELKSPTNNAPGVVVTFDDGYRDLFTEAMPILGRYRIPATVYLTVGSIESRQVAWYDRVFLGLKHAHGSRLECDLGGARPKRFELKDAGERFRAAVEIISTLRSMPNERRCGLLADLEKQFQLPPAELADRMLTWEQIRSMRDEGVSFGCHTMTHPAASRLSMSGLQEELVQAKILMEKRIGRAVMDFSYPFGKPEDCGTQPRSILTQAGYRSAVTTTSGVNVPGVDLYGLLRVSAGDERSLAMFAFQLNQHILHAEAASNSGVSSSRHVAFRRSTHGSQEIVR